MRLILDDINEADLESELAGLEDEMGQELDDEIPDCKSLWFQS